MMKYKFISIEGNIGAGKTSLARLLSKHYKTELILEEYLNNPFLNEFYSDYSNAFPLEISFLNARHNQLREYFSTHRVIGSPLVSDYYYKKSLVFAKANLSAAEYLLYQEIFDKIMHPLIEPDLLIFLSMDVDRLRFQIEKRGRKMEQNIKEEYLEKINSVYLDFLSCQNNTKHLIINCRNIDFVNNQSHFGTILEILAQEFSPGLNQITL